MAQPILEILTSTQTNPLVVDGTMGEGGHSILFLERWPGSQLIGIEADPEIKKIAEKRLSGFGKRFRSILGWNNEVLENWQENAPDIVFLDLGISGRHYRASGLGFSFTANEPLDMRLDGMGQSAADIVNTMDENDLADLIFQYGEERYSRRIANRIVNQRKHAKITHAVKLAEVIESAVPAKARYGRIHAATRTFQALRIAVNDELSRLERLLTIVPPLLASGGKFGVISFHSLEDRRVKTAFRKLDIRFGGDYDIVTRKPIIPDVEECRRNPNSRSAKFRVLHKLSGS